MKNILLVGGSSGIGLEILKRLNSNPDINLINLSRTNPESFNGSHVSLDIRDSELNFDLGVDKLDGLIYCPGSINLKPFTGLKIEDFQNDLEVNYLGAIKILKNVIKLLRKSDLASVVFFTTVASQVGMNFHSSISGAKGALESFSRSLAAEYAPKIRFNCIAPSLTDTPLAGKLLATEKSRQMSIDRHPLKQVGLPEDVASLAEWLLSDESKFVTGQTISMDGGLSNIR
jgi:NAD(P)-dependent dehydrogenase (short-subunit alcohol dehydrogenase family)